MYQGRWNRQCTSAHSQILPDIKAKPVLSNIIDYLLHTQIFIPFADTCVLRWAKLRSIARANLKKSKDFSTSTSTASKYIPKRPRICINWNPPFQIKIYLVNVPLNVNIVKQDLLNKKQFLKILWSEVWKGGFQLMQILGLLGIYFDVEVEKS